MRRAGQEISGRAPFTAMMEAAELGKGNDAPDFRVLTGRDTGASFANER